MVQHKREKNEMKKFQNHAVRASIQLYEIYWHQLEVYIAVDLLVEG